ncbi:MAG TPA: CarD family transcriptional regulator [Blastocatellia bacterium]|nr:CarD family transcriptional regulator [Blastocatellia bacterium]
MILRAGNKVVYPCQGPCLIGALVKQTVGGRPMEFYQLIILNGGGNMFVPVDNVQAVGIRPLLKKAEIPRLLGRLKQPSQAADNRIQRARDNLKLLASGSAYDLAEVVESLTELNETKTLSVGERKILDRAKTLLVYEISEVIGETKEEAEQQLDIALKARIDEVKADFMTGRVLINACNRNRNSRKLRNEELESSTSSGAR